MAKRWNDERYQAALGEQFAGEFSLIGPYVNDKINVTLFHHACGEKFERRPLVFLKEGTGCPCQKQAKKEAAFRQKLSQLSESYEVLSPYVASNKKIIIKHSCGAVRDIVPSNLFARKGAVCKVCHESVYRKTTEELNHDLRFVKKGEYEAVEAYQGYDTEIQFRHRPCGSIFPQTPTLMLSEKNGICPKCSKKPKLKTPETYHQEVLERFHDEYKLLTAYKGSHEPVLVRHETCQKTYTPLAYAFVAGNWRCPYCTQNPLLIAKQQKRSRLNQRERNNDEYTGT